MTDLLEITISGGGESVVVIEESPTITQIGIDGPQGPPGVAPIARGEWNSGSVYAANSAVTYQGASYWAAAPIPAGLNPPPTNSAWQLIAAKGDTGPAWTPDGTIQISAQWRIRDTGAGTLVREFFDGTDWIIKGWDE